MDAGPKHASIPNSDPSGNVQSQQQTDPQNHQDSDLPDSEVGPVEDGILLARVNVPELYISKCLQFPKDQLVWDVKQQCLASLPKVGNLRSFILNFSCYFTDSKVSNSQSGISEKKIIKIKKR